MEQALPGYFVRSVVAWHGCNCQNRIHVPRALYKESPSGSLGINDSWGTGIGTALAPQCR